MGLVSGLLTCDEKNKTNSSLLLHVPINPNVRSGGVDWRFVDVAPSLVSVSSVQTRDVCPKYGGRHGFLEV